MLAEIILKRSARSVSDQTEETLIAPTATLVAVMVRNPRATINFAVSIGGSGGPTYTFPDSVIETAGVVTLEGDELAPSANKYYGTDGAGARGYHALAGTVTLPTYDDSIIETSGVVTLENDVAAPSVQQYYGTDASGARGYYNLPIYPGSYLISGGGVVWTGTGFVYAVAAATYLIGGVFYSSPLTEVTLATSDPTQDRIDVIAVDVTGSVVVVTGTPGTPPIEPQLDVVTQLKLTSILVVAASSGPPVVNELIYLENTEWTTSTSDPTHIALASTSDPYRGTKSIEATAAVITDTITFARPSGTVTPGEYVSFSLYIQSKGVWPRVVGASTFLALTWRDSGGTQIGAAVYIKDGLFGFDSAHTTSYQLIVVPASMFNMGTAPVDHLRITIAGLGGPIGFYIDNVVLQASGDIGVKRLLRNFTFNMRKTSGLVVGKIPGFWTSPFSGLITGWNLIVDTGAITVKIWKIATGTAHPTSSNRINTAGLTLSGATAVRSVDVSDFTTLPVALGDIFACEITAVSGSVTDFGGSIEITT